MTRDHSWRALAGASESNRPLRRAAAVIALLLLGGSVALVLSRRSQLADALQHLQSPSAAPVIVLVASIVAGMFLTGGLFSVLMRRFGRVGFLEMQALVAASALVNFLPLRPGFFGRVAYHKTVNQIAVRHSARVVIEAVVLSVIVAALVAGAVFASVQFDLNLWWCVLGIVPVLLAPAVSKTLAVFAFAGLIRYAEVLLWSARYWAAFALIGSPIDPGAALALACVSMMANLVPLAGNGLGVREWAIGLASPLLSESTLELGITAELVNRAAEIVIIAALGSGAMIWLMRRRR